ncbi:hypothetical protein RCO28_12380 [Streptomyces sp. LHD-70]|uniref:hypothetical protein n=1 Tax=Streptomyces sp. LHD-70 TaxID=3072140 RepID=UPI00280E8DBE|nr:hypothetical protein [Streptomyces sp. LHD-70]MDQ8703278.1 hypothetical protein [Streptomyces sp. LHD-70]
MLIQAVWHGGHNYSHGYDYRDGLESFASIKDAGYELWRRSHMGYGEFEYVSADYKRPVRYDTPAVDETASMDLYAPGSDEPFRRLTLGPRGGVRSESY